METKLKYVITIPSVDIPGYIAINDLVLIGSKDKRYKKIKSENKVLSKYLNSFRTSFNKKVHPSIIVRDESLPKVGAVHLSSFRNAIAVSSVIYSRVQSCLSNTPRGFYCTDLFDFCTVSVSSNGTDLSIKNAFELGIDSVDRFSGQTSPAVVYTDNIHPLFDEELMLALLNLIEAKYKSKSDKEWRNRFIRSLEMAYYALRAPFVHLGEKTDFGVPISLWVSAFEIIANPHVEKVGFKHVSSLIKAVPWKAKKLREKRYAPITSSFAKKRPEERTTLPVQIYGRLYQTRHMYLHGNPIPKGRFEFLTRKNWGNLYFQIPALYRCVLMYSLLRRNVPVPARVRSEQWTYERALSKRPEAENDSAVSG